ncbi:MAG: hypothetical protein CME40_04740 [Haliea sp.]|nr:hypothetical protein [Haliea sp.]
MALEFVLQVFAGGAVGRTEVVDVRHVVEDLTRALAGGSGDMLEQLIKVRERALAELQDA